MTSESLIVKKEIELSGIETGKVWKALISPEAIKQWMVVPPGLYSSRNLKRGTTVQWVTDEGEAYMTGEVIDFAENKRFTISLFDHKWLEAGKVDRVEYTIEVIDDEGLTIRQTFGDLAVDPDGAAWYGVYERANELERLKSLLEA